MRRTAWQTKTTQKHAAGSVVTEEVHCFDIPGGVVEHSSEEFDDNGKLLRRSKLELANYGIATADTTLKRRRPPRKSRRGSHARGEEQGRTGFQFEADAIYVVAQPSERPENWR